jgi:hypothetical protein
MQKKIGSAVYLSIACLWLILSAGCAKPPQAPPAPTKTDPAIVELNMAAKSIHEDLNMLSRIRQEETGIHKDVRAYKTPPQDVDVSQPMTLNWSGPLEPAVQLVAQKVGYRFKVIGAAPAQPVLVSLTAKDKPAFEVLEDIGWQAGKQVGVVLNQELKELQVIYLGSAERIL